MKYGNTAWCINCVKVKTNLHFPEIICSALQAIRHGKNKSISIPHSSLISVSAIVTRGYVGVLTSAFLHHCNYVGAILTTL